MKSISKQKETRATKGVFAGLTTVDLLFLFEQYPDEDTKRTSHKYMLAAGGPASNAAVIFSSLGGKTHLISHIGKDIISEVAKQDILQHDITHINLNENSESCSTISAIAISKQNGSRTIFTTPSIDENYPGPYKNVNNITSCIIEADILLLDGHQLSLSTYIAKIAKKNGTTIVLDGDLYHRDIENILPLVDIVIFGKSFDIPKANTTEGIFEYFLSFGIKHIVATNGENPIKFITNGVIDTIEVKKVSAIDTLGAGDFFHGAFCYYYSSGFNLKDSLKSSAKIAELSVTQFGTRSWLKKLYDAG